MPLVEPSALELKTIRSLANFSGQRVIEIGAGDGRLSWPFAPEAALWIALDLDTDEISLAASAQREKASVNVRLLIGDGRTLSFPAQAFDLALFTWSLCCIPQKEMSSAIGEVHRVLRPGGHLLDVHSTDEPTALEVWYARYQAQADFLEQPENLEAIHRVPVGYLDHEGPPHGFAAATDAIAEALDANPRDFSLQRATTFDYRYFFDSLDELTDYFDENQEYASASDALLERALNVMAQAATTPKLVIVQRVAVTALRKI